MELTEDLSRGDQANTKKEKAFGLLYTVDERPPWHLCLFLGFQHYLTMFGATIAVPLLISAPLCIGPDYKATSELIGTVFFVSGLVTICQSTFGSRLPIVQGATMSFLIPSFVILAQAEWQCPNIIQKNSTNVSCVYNATTVGTSCVISGSAIHREVWQTRIREIQGAIILASLFQVLIGFSGLVGFLVRFVGPLTIAPTITLIGLSLFKAAGDFAGKQWWIALTTIAMIVLFSQYLRDVTIPVPTLTRKNRSFRCSLVRLPVFKLFPVLMGIIVTWIICIILTSSGALPSSAGVWGYEARTDTKLHVLQDSMWFRFPLPGQWGTPTFSLGSVFGMLSGVLAGMIESIGDYYACARLAGAPMPPVAAINRGIFVEGIGCVLAGIWGSGSGTTSYSENIGAIGITKVGSRAVVQTGGVVMLFLGVFAKFGALFVTIPDPIIGGMFMVMFGMPTAVGISNLQFVDLNSSRNIFILGFSIFFGLTLPEWMKRNPNVIHTGSTIVDQIFTILFSTSMFVGGLTGLFLDSSIPGTGEERGMLAWRNVDNDFKEDIEKKSCYDLPWPLSKINKFRWTRFIPILPRFTGWSTLANKKSGKVHDLNTSERCKFAKHSQA